MPLPEKKPLDIRATFDAIVARYQAPRRSLNAFIYGFPKKGKTHLLRTARKPVLLYQFDPNGDAPLRDLIEKGEVIVADFSRENDAGNPKMFKEWEKAYMEHKASGLFDFVGTVAIDSVTSWVNALGLEILKRNGRPVKMGGVELFHKKGGTASLYEDRDYGIQLITLTQYTANLVALPCDTIFLAHARDHEDRKTERRTFSPLLAGQLKTQMPLLFDEVYVLETVKVPPKDGKPEGLKRVLYTRPTGRYELAGSRYESLLAFEEPADIKALLRTLKLDAEDIVLPNREEV